MNRFGWIFVALFTLCLGIIIGWVTFESGAYLLVRGANLPVDDLHKAVGLKWFRIISFSALVFLCLSSAFFRPSLQILSKRLRSGSIRPIAKIKDGYGNIQILAFNKGDEVVRYKLGLKETGRFREFLQELPLVNEMPTVTVKYEVFTFQNSQVAGTVKEKCLDIQDAGASVNPEVQAATHDLAPESTRT